MVDELRSHSLPRRRSLGTQRHPDIVGFFLEDLGTKMGAFRAEDAALWQARSAPFRAREDAELAEQSGNVHDDDWWAWADAANCSRPHAEERSLDDRLSGTRRLLMRVTSPK